MRRRENQTVEAWPTSGLTSVSSGWSADLERFNPFADREQFASIGWFEDQQCQAAGPDLLGEIINEQPMLLVMHGRSRLMRSAREGLQQAARGLSLRNGPAVGNDISLAKIIGFQMPHACKLDPPPHAVSTDEG
jgi:hypothetical protein